LLELLHRLFFASDILAPDDLAYALDAPRPVDEDELLGRAVQVLSPERILRELVIGNRLAAVEAGSFLGVENAGELGREDLLGRLLWKLGVPSSVIFGDLLRVAKYEGELAASSKAGAPSDTVRGHISNLFAAVEDALQRALEYITWSLTTDHFMEEGGFRYDPDPSPDVFQFIDEHSPMSDPALRLRGDGKNTIVPLAAGFARLAKGLKATSFDEYTRRRDLVPHICRVTGRPFVFAYTLPFLALTEGSRDSVLSDLHAIGQYIQDPNVVKVRNAGIHGNNQFPTAEELKSAVENIHLCRLRLRSTGVYPTVFNLVATEVDAFGRAISRYRGEVDEVVLQTPQWAVAPSLPSKLPQLLVIPAARMMSVGPMRFRLNPRGRNDPYWDGWPKRWRTDNSYESGDREVDLNEVSDVAG
jgi:hypothetical protein